MASTKRSEAGIQRDIELAVGRLSHAFIIRRTVERLFRADGTPVRIGLTGEPDLQGVIGNQSCPNCGCPIHPKPFGIEVKAARGRLEKSQINYRDNIAGRIPGWLYIVAKSVEDAKKGLGL